jgi:ERCC4 domain
VAQPAGRKVDPRVVALGLLALADRGGVLVEFGDTVIEADSLREVMGGSDHRAFGETVPVELLIARNPDPDSTLPYLLRVPLSTGLIYRTKGTWPRTGALYCHPVPVEEWPAEPDIVERVPLLSCARRGAAIDVVADRAREQRSQIALTKARGRDVVFWQTPRTRRQSRPVVRLPTARAAGLTGLEIVVDTRERYPFGFAAQQADTVRRALPCGDYAVTVGGRTVAAVERKSVEDLVTSLMSGKLRYAFGELAAVPRAALVVEAGYSRIFKLEHARPSQVADDLAELQVRWPTVPIAFCETRKLAEEWTYRYLAAAFAWASDEQAAVARLDVSWPSEIDVAGVPAAPAPSTAEVRAWARAQGIEVPARGRLRPEVHEAWRQAALHSG